MKLVQALYAILPTLSIFCLGAALVASTGCLQTQGEANLKTLLPPGTQAQEAAAEFKSHFPKARIFFSQNSGEILWVDGGQASLAHGPTDSAPHALAVVQKFMDQFPNLFRVQDPVHALQSIDSDLRTGGKALGVISLHFEQLQNGIPIRGKYGVAIFDASGNLLSIQARLLPTEQFQIAQSPGGAGSTSQALTTTAELNPQILTPMNRLKNRTFQRRIWESVTGGKNYHLIEERVERSNIQVTRTLRDSATGQVIQSWDETPSSLIAAPLGWEKSGSESSVPANSALGTRKEIPSTRLSGALILGFHLKGVHTEGSAVIINDDGTRAQRDIVPEIPLTTDAADWLSEPAFEPDLRAATGLALNVATTLEWYLKQLHHASWDGQGSSVFAAIRGHRATDPAPEFNSWGSGGMILIGDGLSPTGQPGSEALDIVAHEFTHSVIDATAGFEYHDEAGALNESLADIFGKSVEGFSDTIHGSSIGAHIRDLLNPATCSTPSGASCAQPDRYSDYQIIAPTSDHGGVHTNSGIMSRALSLVIKGSALAGLSQPQIPAAGPVALTALLLDALKGVSFASDTWLEEFAAETSAYCRCRERAGTLTAEQVTAKICEGLESSFLVSQLLSAPM